MAKDLHSLGFVIEGWSRTKKEIEGVNCHYGENSIEELIKNIDMQRQFEINVKLIKKASDLDAAGAKLMNLPS